MQSEREWLELDGRVAEGREISLLWCRADGVVAVRVIDRSGNASLLREVPARCAADAFRHPFAYATSGRPLSPAGDRDAPDGAPPRAGAVDVDELWLSELAEVVLADLAKLLADCAKPGEHSDGEHGV